VIAQTLQPVLNTRNDSPIRFLGLPTAMRATSETTNGAFGLVEQLMMPPGFASPYHVHHVEDEAFYVLEGEIAFVCGGTWMTAGPGAYVFGPRNIPHGFKVVGDTAARMLLLCAPAGFEKFVLDLSEPEPAPGMPAAPPDMARLVATAAKYHIDILGSLPESPESLTRAQERAVTTHSPSAVPTKDAVDRVRDQHIAAVNAGDVEAAVNLFASGGVFLPPGQPALQGTPAIRAWFTHVFTNFRIEGFGLQPEALEAHGDVMIEHGSWKAAFQPIDGSPHLTAGGTYLTVYARLSNGDVRMIRDTFNGMPG
jgi:ketosteroid isomerase-like protein/quercetin dioxygenase-like cupin family protein